MLLLLLLIEILTNLLAWVESKYIFMWSTYNPHVTHYLLNAFDKLEILHVYSINWHAKKIFCFFTRRFDHPHLPLVSKSLIAITIKMEIK